MMNQALINIYSMMKKMQQAPDKWKSGTPNPLKPLEQRAK
jgi:hypothetical protein